jgi:2-polyprenyl-3-methyl-5-hydroxy-6-metoxy-1,4-benzoquinol methylase
VPPTSPRYDAHADWYVSYTSDWNSAAATFIPDDLAGQSVLDLACGWGQLSRILANRHARVTGVDQSERLLDHAREVESPAGSMIRYVPGDATELDWWDGTPFDGVVCNMALMDIDDLPAAMSNIGALLRPSGWFVFSLFHPCYPGDPNNPSSRPSWPPDGGYSAEQWWTTGQSGVRGHVGAHHRMLSTYLNAVLDAGLSFERFSEGSSQLPERFLARCRRSTSDT